MLDLFEKWISIEAKWYQFWLPNSGSVGGLIMGNVILVILVMVFL